jgi:hypothetical protein
MNPLRPRILAAGGWFAIFMVVPFALVWELRTRLASFRDDSKLFQGHVALIVTYMTSANILIFSSTHTQLFVFESTAVANRWMAFRILGIGLCLLVLIIVYIRGKVRLSRLIASLLAAGFYGSFVVDGLREVLLPQQFQNS